MTGTKLLMLAAGHCMSGGQRTNNEAEYEALVAAAVACRARGAKRLKVYSDSELMVKQLYGSYKVKSPKLLEPYRQACSLLRSFEKGFEVIHVKRHLNTESDFLCNLVLDEAARRGDREHHYQLWVENVHPSEVTEYQANFKGFILDRMERGGSKRARVEEASAAVATDADADADTMRKKSRNDTADAGADAAAAQRAVDKPPNRQDLTANYTGMASVIPFNYEASCDAIGESEYQWCRSIFLDSVRQWDDDARATSPWEQLPKVLWLEFARRGSDSDRGRALVGCLSNDRCIKTHADEMRRAITSGHGRFRELKISFEDNDKKPYWSDVPMHISLSDCRSTDASAVSDAQHGTGGSLEIVRVPRLIDRIDAAPHRGDSIIYKNTRWMLSLSSRGANVSSV